MDFELTEFQTDLAAGVRRLCQGRFALEGLRRFEGSEQVVDRERWRELGEAGVFNLCRAEGDGGCNRTVRAAIPRLVWRPVPQESITPVNLSQSLSKRVIPRSAGRFSQRRMLRSLSGGGRM